MVHQQSERSASIWGLPAPLRLLINDELEAGETIRWLGQPLMRRYARKAWPAVLFGIPWTVITLLVMSKTEPLKGANGQPRFNPFLLFSIPFLLVGFWMLTSPLWFARTARKTAYVLTDRRAIIIEGLSSAKIRSFHPSQLTQLRRLQHPDGSGDVIFIRELTSATEEGARGLEVGFLAIPSVKAVEAMVRELAEGEPAENP